MIQKLTENVSGSAMTAMTAQVDSDSEIRRKYEYRYVTRERGHNKQSMRWDTDIAYKLETRQTNEGVHTLYRREASYEG